MEGINTLKNKTSTYCLPLTLIIWKKSPQKLSFFLFRWFLFVELPYFFVTFLKVLNLLYFTFYFCQVRRRNPSVPTKFLNYYHSQLQLRIIKASQPDIHSADSIVWNIIYPFILIKYFKNHRHFSPSTFPLTSCQLWWDCSQTAALHVSWTLLTPHDCLIFYGILH